MRWIIDLGMKVCGATRLLRMGIRSVTWRAAKVCGYYDAETEGDVNGDLDYGETVIIDLLMLIYICTKYGNKNVTHCCNMLVYERTKGWINNCCFKLSPHNYSYGCVTPGGEGVASPSLGVLGQAQNGGKEESLWCAVTLQESVAFQFCEDNIMVFPWLLLWPFPGEVGGPPHDSHLLLSPPAITIKK